MKIKHIALQLFLLLNVVWLSAQNNTNSPYSSKGFGETEPFTNTYNRALGGTFNGVRSARNISLSNPASLGAITSVVFDFAFRADYTKISNEANYKTANNGSFNYFTLGVPIYRKLAYKQDSTNKNLIFKSYRTIWSSAIGLIPYSTSNSLYYREKDTSFGSTTNFYSINGSINKFFWMNAYNVTKSWSVGANLAYLFGQKNNERSLLLNDSARSHIIFDNRKLRINGFAFSFGTQFERNKDTFRRYKRDTSGKIIGVKTRTLKVVFGASLNSNNTLNAKINQLIVSQSLVYNSIRDTIYSNEIARQKTRLPLGFSMGASITLSNLWMFSFDYQRSLLSLMDKNVFQDSFSNSTQFNFGFAYRPDMDPESHKKRKLNLEYRFGFRYNNTGINFVDNLGYLSPMKEYGISFGIGIPRNTDYWDGKKMTNKSMINLTAEYIKRGTVQNGLISEDLYRLTVGFNLSDVWFVKRKYN